MLGIALSIWQSLLNPPGGGGAAPVTLLLEGDFSGDLLLEGDASGSLLLEGTQ